MCSTFLCQFRLSFSCWWISDEMMMMKMIWWYGSCCTCKSFIWYTWSKRKYNIPYTLYLCQAISKYQRNTPVHWSIFSAPNKSELTWSTFAVKLLFAVECIIVKFLDCVELKRKSCIGKLPLPMIVAKLFKFLQNVLTKMIYDMVHEFSIRSWKVPMHLSFLSSKRSAFSLFLMSDRIRIIYHPLG